MGDDALLDYARAGHRARRMRTGHWAAVVLVLFCAFWFWFLVRLGIKTPSLRSTAMNGAASLRAGLDAFKLDNGRYPTAAEGLAALVAPPVGLNTWKGPYLDPRRLPATDPWGRPYAYTPPAAPSRGAVVLSLGPDGKAGTADDVVAGP
jgi:type II secretion system protein G